MTEIYHIAVYLNHAGYSVHVRTDADTRISVERIKIPAPLHLHNTLSGIRVLFRDAGIIASLVPLEHDRAVHDGQIDLHFKNVFRVHPDKV